MAVRQFAPGSVRVHFSLGWQTVEDSGERIITTAMVTNRITEQLKHGSGYLFGKFAMTRDSVRVGYTRNQCSNLQCTYACHFSYARLRPECTCPKVRKGRGVFHRAEVPNWCYLSIAGHADGRPGLHGDLPSCSKTE